MSDEIVPATVVLVETDLLFASRICSVLERMDCKVQMASTLEAALEAVQCDELNVDLVICNLAHCQSLPLVRKLKALDDTRRPRVLAYISHVKIPEIRQAAIEAGVDKLCANSAVHLRLPDLVHHVLSGTGPSEEA